MIVITIITFIIVLAILIFVHELGHFIAARIFGIRVDAFALGFGPKIISWKFPSKHVTTINDTEYSIRLIPFGGFVKIFGETPDAESMVGPDASRSFVNKPRWQQAIVLAAGVLCNFIFAWILYVIVFTSGVASPSGAVGQYDKYLSNERIMITQIMKDSPAEKAGLVAGDVITGFNTITDIQDSIKNSDGKAVKLNIISYGIAMSSEIIPTKASTSSPYAIGIGMDQVSDLRLPFYISIWEGFKYTGIMIKDTAVGLVYFIGAIIHGTADYSQVSGPVGIAKDVGDATRLGFSYLVMLTAIISINLGVINLIPFPALDGGRILVVAIESVIRRRVLPKYINIVNTIGFVLLLALMVLVTYKDIVKLLR